MYYSNHNSSHTAPVEPTDEVYVLCVTPTGFGQETLLLCRHLSTVQYYLEEMAKGLSIQKRETYTDALGVCVCYDCVEQISLHDDFGIVRPSPEERDDMADHVAMRAEVTRTTVSALIEREYSLADVRSEIMDS